VRWAVIDGTWASETEPAPAAFLESWRGYGLFNSEPPALPGL
jgi:hypothetical protein